MRLRFIILLSITVLVLFSCKYKHHRHHEKVAIAHIDSQTIHLFYNGALKPIKVDSISSPTEGTIDGLYFNYGQFIKKDQPLLSMNSKQIQSDFRESLSNFLRAKQSYLDNQARFYGTEELHKAKIISEQEYASEKNQMQNSVLTFIDAKFKLEQTIKDIPGIDKSIETSSLSNLEAVNQLLQKQFDHIKIGAISPGIVLFPEKSANDDNNKAERQIHVGNQIKKGETLLTIGDLSGLAIEFEVNEVDINRIKRGQKVSVTSPAEPDLLMKGYIDFVGAQAKTEDVNGTVTFPVKAIVPHLTLEQQQKIRIGMSAKVDIIITQAPHIIVPINAVFQKSGHDMITVLDRIGRHKDVEITAGPTTVNDVAILSGIHSGDKVVIHD